MEGGIPLLWCGQARTERYATSQTHVEKQKLESVENIPAFLRQSDIGQFGLWAHFTFHHDTTAAAAGNHVWFVPGWEMAWPDPKGLIKSIDVIEAIRCLGSGHKHDVGPVWNVVPAPSVGHGGESHPPSLRLSKRGKERKTIWVWFWIQQSVQFI